MKNLKKSFLILMAIMCVSLIFGLSANAIDLTRTKGSLTIKKYEKGAVGHEGENIPLKGVEFTIYKVSDDEVNTNTPGESVIPTAQGTTKEDGKVTFEELDIGRYLVVETKIPENVTERIANFLVDIPQTTVGGTDLNYDVIVEPKNNSAYGSIKLKKEGINGAKLQGVTFILQKKNNETWKDYPDSEKAILSTDENGEIKVDNLPIGDYRFIEKSLGNNDKGYILDNQTGYEFNVALDIRDYKTIVTPDSITVINDKLGITKEIEHITKNEANTNTVIDEKNSTDIGDTITYKTETDIPNSIKRLNTYTITDTMDKGLTLKKDSFKIKAGDITLENADYTVTELDELNGFILKINESGKEKLDTAYKANSKKMTVFYDVTLNSNADVTIIGNRNKAKLSYSNIVNKNYKGDSNNPEDPTKVITTEEVETVVYTGGLLIEKRENNRDGALLSGAVFKLASTKSNAEKKSFIKDSTGNEITLTTGEDGKVSYKGLTYGKYYLVEVQAPSYTEGGKTKYYNLLNKPIEITVSNNTYTENANIVINKKPTILPYTGALGTIGMVIAGITLISLGIIIYKKK